MLAALNSQALRRPNRTVSLKFDPWTLSQDTQTRPTPKVIRPVIQLLGPVVLICDKWISGGGAGVGLDRSDT